MGKQAVNMTTAWLVNAVKAAPKRQRVDYSDITRGLSIRVNDRRDITFTYVGRFPSKDDPTKKVVTRRTIGTYSAGIEKIEAELKNGGKALPGIGSAMSLARAREIANNWSTLLDMSIDPKKHEDEIAAREKLAAEENDRRAQNTFGVVVEAYLKDIPTRERNRHVEQDEREIRRELLTRTEKDGSIWKNPWAQKPISAVTDADVATLIKAVRDRPAPGMAYNVWGHIKAIFSWAMWPERRQGYGLTVNPIAHLQPKHFKLSKTASIRVLSDEEIRAYWLAAEKTSYPLGPFYMLLMLSGQRKTEVSDIRRREINQSLRRWTVPKERFKSAQEHIVPLSPGAIALVNSLPEFKEKSDDCLFTTTNGKKPINGFSKAKSELDKLMLEELRKEDHDAVLEPWVFHDVRRTVRTRLSELRVQSDVAELVIGHGKTGLRRVYDQYEFEPQMREALDRWAARLKSIVEPPPENVVDFDLKRA